MPLANASVTHAGQPSKVGGTVVRVLGWGVLAGGWLVAALVAGLLLLLGGQGAAAVVGGSIAVVTALVAYALLRGGRGLQQSGEDTELAMKNQALFALAKTRGGVLKAWDAAQMLNVGPSEADAILTKLAKEHPDHVTVDIDEDGTLLYRFLGIYWGGVRVDAPGPAVRVDAREPLDDESIEEAALGRKAR
jgi:hypothetical protein